MPGNHFKSFDHGSPLCPVLYKYNAVMHIATGSHTAGPVVHLLLHCRMDLALHYSVVKVGHVVHCMQLCERKWLRFKSKLRDK